MTTNFFYNQAINWLNNNFPSAGNLCHTETSESSDLLPTALYVLSLYINKIEGSLDRFYQGLEAFAELSFDFIRLQSRFLKTGEYHNEQSHTIIEEIYYNKERMESYYLDGLFLTYAFWPNHIKLYKYFRDMFLTKLTSFSRIIEIGIGHGLMALDVLKTCQVQAYDIIDISPFSLNYALDVMQKNEANISPVRMTEANLGNRDSHGMPDLSHDSFQAGIMCEVLEHVESPDNLLKELFDALGSQGIAFISTCANIEAEDHIFRFESVEHIRQFITNNGFSIMDEKVLPLHGFASGTLQPINYASIITRD